MTERKITPKTIQTYAQATWSEFPKDKNGIIYVRQSSLAQVRRNLHSYEMQTDAFEAHFRQNGCTGQIWIKAENIKKKMSGTLDISDRPALDETVQMVREAKKYNLGWVAAVHVNRLTRDLYLITPGVLMKACLRSGIWIATLDRLYNFQIDECREKFIDEAKKSADQLVWMKQIMGGAKLVASANGYYDGRNLSPGYIVDRRDPLHMTYVVYQLHAEIVDREFDRFVSLDGDFPKYIREVDALPYLFPPFESWVDPRNISRFVISQIEEGPYAGYYKPTADGLRSMLTNPVYTGLWIPFEGEPIPNHHEAIVSSAKFAFSFKRLARIDLNGQRLKPARQTRKYNSEALLVKVLKDDDDNPIYKDHTRGKLYYQKLKHTWMKRTHGFSIEHSIIDSAFLEMLFLRITTLEEHFTDWKDTIEQANKRIENRRTSVTASVKEARRLWTHNMKLLKNPDVPKTEQMEIDLAKTIAGLEARIADLEKQLTPKQEESEAITLYQIHTLIPRISTEWKNFQYATKLLVISGLVRRVVLSQVSSGWLKMQIVWKLPDWGIDVGHIRKLSSKASWSKEEEEVIRRLYPEGEVLEMLKALPNRNWNGIQEHASYMKVNRVLSRREAMRSTVESGIPTNISLDDWEYAQATSLSFLKKVQWSSLPSCLPQACCLPGR